MTLGMKTSIRLILLFAVTFFFGSCVSLKQFNETKGRLNSTLSENSQLKQNKMELETANAELFSRVELLNSQNKELKTQLDEALYNLNIQKQNNSAISKEKADLQHQLDGLKSGSTAEIEKLLTDLQLTRGDLNTREDKLREAERELERKNARLIELQNILAQQEQAVKELKDKVMNALVGFNNNGLTVHEKNGKVYVSLDEQLLFRTGRWDVDPNGQRALRELSTVLAQNPEINIMVEGHTDDVPMRGAGDVKDNWDLSVMRATAVTKILTQNSQIDPKRIIAAGRSEYLPLSPEKTTEDRQINRRTEIILTPNLDELLKIFDME
jgi:chemotaxis protein MotB